MEGADSREFSLTSWETALTDQGYSHSSGSLGGRSMAFALSLGMARAFSPCLIMNNVTSFLFLEMQIDLNVILYNLNDFWCLS